MKKTNNIKLYRKRLGLSQKDLAEKMNCTQQLVSVYEKGSLPVKSDDIDKMLQVFMDITYDELFDTGVLSFYLSSENQRYLEEYIRALDGEDSYSNKSLILNHILKSFFEQK